MTFRILVLFLLLLPVPASGDAKEQWTANEGQLVLQGVPQIPSALVNRLTQYQNVRSALFMDWTGDGKGIYIRTRFDDINQLHRVHAAGGVRQQLTWFPEPVGQVLRRPESEHLALTMDEGGGELDQIFLFDPATATTTRVTDGLSRNRQICWSRDGRKLAFQSTRRNGRNNDLWIMDPDDPGSAKLLLEAPDGSWLAPVDFSRDGKFLLVQQFMNVTDSRILVLKLEDGSLRTLAGDSEQPSANRALSFDHRGEGFYLITNVRDRSAELAWQPINPEITRQYITAQIPWDVTDFAISENGKRGAIVTNEEGLSRLYLLDTRSGKLALVKRIPVGIINRLKFNRDNRRLAMSLSTAQSPSDVYVLDIGRSSRAAKSITRWTFSEVGGLDTNSFAEPKLVRYPTFDLIGDRPRTIPAFVYRPPGKGPHPVIIYVHGGPESQYRPSFSSTFQMWVAELGAAVIAPNIRGSTGYDNEFLSLDDREKREDAVRDIGALLDWISTQPGLDADRVAIYGTSYGGYVVLASTVLYGDRLRAGVDVVGISNFVTFLENTEDYRRELRRYEYGDERDPEMRAILQEISPLNNVDKIDTPLLVVQGRNDPRVPVGQSKKMVQALNHRGRPVWYIEALNEGHGYNRKENRTVYEQATILFLQKFLLE